MDVREILDAMMSSNASDLHIKVATAPLMPSMAAAAWS